jgi:hypothetical protein
MGDDGDIGEGGPKMSLPSLGVGDGGVIGRPGFPCEGIDIEKDN